MLAQGFHRGRLVHQPGVLDGDGRLIGEQLQQAQVVLVEGPPGPIVGDRGSPRRSLPMREDRRGQGGRHRASRSRAAVPIAGGRRSRSR